MHLKPVLLFRRIQQTGSNGAFLLFIAVAASVVSIGSNAMANTILCKSDKAVRTLRTDKPAGGGCTAVYTKEGVDQVVGSSTHENGCNSILSTIRKTLEGSSWKCKETKSGVVSNLTP